MKTVSLLLLIIVLPNAGSAADWRFIGSTSAGLVSACAIAFVGYAYFHQPETEPVPPGTLLYMDSEALSRASICTLSLPLLDGDTGASASISCDSGFVAKLAGLPPHLRQSRNSAMDGRSRIYDKAKLILLRENFTLASNSYAPADIRALPSFVFVKIQ